MIRSRAVAVVAVLAALAGLGGVLGGAALAEHRFTDVDDESVFHDDIDDFTDAGCALGYPGNTFRPTDPVNRQQMARFVHACAGRMESTLGAVADVGSPTQIVDLDLEPGALSGAGFVLVTISVRISSLSTTGFPCEVLFDMPFLANEEVWLDLPFDTADDVEDASGAIHTSFAYPSGDGLPMPLQVSLVNDCAATVTAHAKATATYWPFDGEGHGGPPF
jgi:hypothetical protein